MANRIREEKCPAPGCPRGIQVAGYCDKHYRRMKNHGSLDLPPKPTEPERFWAKVDKSGDCWEWTGHVRKDGSGQFRRGDHVVNAHRVSYELTHGPIPDALEIDHLCRNRSCVNPSPKHLEAVPKPVNILRGIGEGAKHARKTHCTHGHPLSGDNIYPNSLPERRCITCARDNARRNKARRARAAKIQKERIHA